MTRRRWLVLVLVIASLVSLAAPARAGLLDSLLGTGGPAAGERAWTLGGRPCQLIDVPDAASLDTAAPFGVGSCPGVRPGAIAVTDTGACTLNFLFTDPAGGRYMGTAGHCILATSLLGTQDNGEVRFAAGEGPGARDAAGNRIGEFVYAIQQDPKDFALIRLDPGVEASPQVCSFGGPTGVNDERPGLLEPTVLSSYGNPLGVGTGVTAKTFVALGMPSADHVFATGAVLPGDSGGPVLDGAGRAVGLVVSTGLHLGDSPLSFEGLDAGLVGITRLTPQLERAETVLGTDLELATAPRL
ncbi:MAG TPA: trypsin-like peptidase domain-containing protein [Acidimicrobiales bacterium]|nr:trypsin-like peptidase domain-containing protein [Acidimicrobiales bacterium]